MAVLDRPTDARHNVLDTELATYEKHRDELLGKAEGRYALIKGTQVDGVFESRSDAIMIGYQKFGNVPFLVKQIIRVEAPQRFVSNHIAL